MTHMSDRTDRLTKTLENKHKTESEQIELTMPMTPFFCVCRTLVLFLWKLYPVLVIHIMNKLA